MSLAVIVCVRRKYNIIISMTIKRISGKARIELICMKYSYLHGYAYLHVFALFYYLYARSNIKRNKIEDTLESMN